MPMKIEKWELPVAAPETEVSRQFIQGMLDRMAVSWAKYGNIADAYPHKVSALASLHQRLESYIDTGNTEYLIDAANFAMIEFLCPSVEGAHFKSTDSDGSPGRTTTDGDVTAEKNSRL